MSMCHWDLSMRLARVNLTPNEYLEKSGEGKIEGHVKAQDTLPQHDLRGVISGSLRRAMETNNVFYVRIYTN